MFSNVLTWLKTPVTTLIEKSEQEDLKKGAIKLAILSAVSSLISVISVLINIFTREYSSYYEEEEIWEMKMEALESADLFGAFFRGWVALIVTVAIIAVILYIIARIVKSPKDYAVTLSMVNNVAILNVAASLLNLIISFIYAPLGIIISCVVAIYGFFSLLYAFKDSLNLENSDKLVLAFAGLFLVVIVVLVILFYSILGDFLDNLSDLTDVFSSFDMLSNF